jgi:hypothetical protein
MERAPMNHMSLRIAGVVLILAVLFVLDLTVDNATNQLWLPMLLAAGAYLMTLSLMAVAIAVGTLAILHMDLQAVFWVQATAYPILVAISAVIIGWTLLQRFRQRIKDTHDERWANRRPEQDE